MPQPFVSRLPSLASITTSPATAPRAFDEMTARRAGLVAAERDVTPAMGSVWEPPDVARTRAPTSSEVIAAERIPASLPADVAAAIIATICRPLHPGENHHTGHANRERELCAVFDRLALAQIHELARRLDLDRDDDALAVAFRRLVVDRRQRLRGFLADTRRRRAIAAR